MLWHNSGVMKSPTPFAAALASAIAKKIKSEKAEGITGMSMDNLMMVVRPPSSALAGAPLGTNSAWHYRETFREVAAGIPAVKKFLI